MRLALSALAMVRSGADPEGAVIVLLGLASNNAEAVRLGRSRCLAAVDQGDQQAVQALALLDEVLHRLDG
jgi:hypothetical protein